MKQQQSSPNQSPSFLHQLSAWIDSAKYQESIVFDPLDKKVEWARVIPFIILHGGCLGILIWGTSWVAVATCFFLYFIRMFAITGFYHRYFSHRTFKTNRFWQFIFAAMGNSSAQRGPLWWAAHHRHHHRHSDKEEDVHSPHQHSFVWSHMLWIATRSNFISRYDEVKDLAKYPELMWLDRYDSVVPLALAIGTVIWGFGLNYFFPSLGTSGMQMLIWGFFVSTVLLFHGTCTINSLSHLFGTRRYETTDQSRNNPLLAIITLGEGWHNNHHHYPASARQGFFWWEYDITYYMLKVLSMVGIIHDLKPVPLHVRDGKGHPRDKS